MPPTDAARRLRADACHPSPIAERRRSRSRSRRWLLATALLAAAALQSACDRGGRPAPAEPPAADANVAPTAARSERFVLQRDSQQSGRSQQIARSPNFTLIREEARNAPR